MDEKKKSRNLGRLFLSPGMRMAMGNESSPTAEKLLFYTGVFAGAFILVLLAAFAVSSLLDL